jgi:hypothetical protein
MSNLPYKASNPPVSNVVIKRRVFKAESYMVQGPTR